MYTKAQKYKEKNGKIKAVYHRLRLVIEEADLVELTNAFQLGKETEK